MRPKLFRRFLCVVVLAAALPTSSPAQKAAAPREAPAGDFAPLETWRAAVLAGDAAELKALYSVNPPATVAIAKGKSTDVQQEVQFWTDQKANGLTAISLSEIRRQSTREDDQQVIFQAELTSHTQTGTRKLYISVGIFWQRQGGTWRIVASQRNDAARLRQPLTRKDLYPANEDANTEIKEALGRAASGHKRVLLVFGGNWCYDCHVLDAAFHSAEIAPLVTRSYELVHVDVGEYNKNLDIAKRYDVPLEKGVPAVAVLESDGTLLYSQKGGEFEKARSMGPEDVVAFLQRWKPAASGK